MVESMIWTRRGILAAAVAGLALQPAFAAAEPGALSRAARRRLGGLARRTLPRDEIRTLLASDAAVAAGPCGCADPVALTRLVREDFRARRTLDLGGVRFARAEVAAFLRA